MHTNKVTSIPTTSCILVYAPAFKLDLLWPQPGYMNSQLQNLTALTHQHNWSHWTICRRESSSLDSHSRLLFFSAPQKMPFSDFLWGREGVSLGMLLEGTLNIWLPFQGWMDGVQYKTTQRKKNHFQNDLLLQRNGGLWEGGREETAWFQTEQKGVLILVLSVSPLVLIYAKNAITNGHTRKPNLHWFIQALVKKALPSIPLISNAWINCKSVFSYSNWRAASQHMHTIYITQGNCDILRKEWQERGWGGKDLDSYSISVQSFLPSPVWMVWWSHHIILTGYWNWLLHWDNGLCFTRPCQKRLKSCPAPAPASHVHEAVFCSQTCKPSNSALPPLTIWPWQWFSPVLRWKGIFPGPLPNFF